MPSKRVIAAAIGGLAAIFLVGLGVFRQRAFAAGEIRFLNSFDLKREITGLTPESDLALAQMRVTSERLYCLVFIRESGPGRRGLIVSRALDGSVTSAIAVPEGTTDFLVERNGYIVVHAVDRGGGQASLRRLHPITGAASTIQSLPAPLLGVWSAGDQLYGLGWDGRLCRLDESPRWLDSVSPCHECGAGQPPPSLAVQPLLGNILAVIRQDTAEIDFVATAGPSVRRVRLATPEIELARARYQAIRERWERESGRDNGAMLARGLIVPRSTVDERGNLYLAVSAQDYYEGTPVVVTDNAGVVLETLRVPESRVPSKNRFAMVAFAVRAGRLFAGNLTGLVAVFEIR